jgi:hypothetical protein
MVRCRGKYGGLQAHAYHGWLVSRSSLMAVMPGPAAPPASMGWLGGGIVDIGLPSAFTRVPPGVLLPRPVLWLRSCEGSMIPSTFIAACCCLLASVANASLCRGDECIGDADFLL